MATIFCTLLREIPAEILYEDEPFQPKDIQPRSASRTDYSKNDSRTV